MESANHGINAHASSFLDYYFNNDELRYAVLINGPWGIGKTHFLKHYFKKTDVKISKHAVWVSLYGVSNANELARALFAAAHPKIAKGSSVAMGAARAMGSFLGGDLSSLDEKAWVKIGKDKHFVIDDLERSSMDVNEALGILNDLVEQDGRKLIILANEDEIDKWGKSEDPGDERKAIASKYTKQKEKVIGKTLKIRSDFHAAFASFSESIKNSWCKSFLITNKSIVHKIYTQWEGENLRALQRTLWDLERVVVALTEDTKNNTKGMEFLLKWFLAFSLEIRGGGIRPLEFLESDLALANKKYSGFGLTTPVLSDFAIMQIILEGVVDRELINKEIIGSLPFRKEIDREPWIQLLEPWNFSSEELEIFSKELESKFQSHGYVDPITIIHVCMLRIWLAEIGRPGKTKDDILLETKEYITKLDEDGKLPLPSAKAPWTEAVFRNPQIQYAKSDDDLTEIIDYFLHIMRRQFGKKLEDWSEEILALLKTDIITFYKRTCVTTFESSFVHVPVFSKIEPTVFVDCLLSVPSENQKMALEALRERYRSANNNLNLKPEFLWIADVEVELKSRKEHLIYFDKSRVDFFIDQFLKPIKEEIDKFTKNENPV